MPPKFRVDRVVPARGDGVWRGGPARESQPIGCAPAGGPVRVALSALDAFESRFAGPHFCYRYASPLCPERLRLAFSYVLREVPWLGGSIEASDAGLVVDCGAPGGCEFVMRRPRAKKKSTPVESEI